MWTIAVALLPAALAGCATQPSAQTPLAAAPSAASAMVCRQIATPAPYDTNPVYCGTAEQVAAVQSQPSLLNDPVVVCMKVPPGSTSTRLSAAADAPVCMLPEQWQRSGLVARNANWSHGHSTLTDAAREQWVTTTPPIPGIDVWVPPGQVPGQP